MSRISAKTASIAESETATLIAKASQLMARGVDVISFGAGQPDHPTPAAIAAAAAHACFDPRHHRYTSTAGHPELRAAVAAATPRDDRGYGPDDVVITNGAKQAVLNALTVLVDPGDEVLIPAPYWVTYPAAVRLAGGVPSPVPTEPEDGFKVTASQLEFARGLDTKALVLSSPCNPTGAVYTAQELEAIGAWAQEAGIWVISDEIYEDFVYPPATFASIASASSFERVVVVGGASKTYAMTGWRVGWLLGPPDVVAAAINLQSHTTFHVNNVAQVAALAALTGDQSFVDEVVETFDRRRKTIVALLSDLPGFSVQEPFGAFYAFADVRALLGRALGGSQIDSSDVLANVLLDRAAIAVLPGEAFGAPGFLRFSYALADRDLLRGMERLADLLDALER